jgi:hypothetical protein
MRVDSRYVSPKESKRLNDVDSLGNTSLCCMQRSLLSGSENPRLRHSAGLELMEYRVAPGYGLKGDSRADLLLLEADLRATMGRNTFSGLLGYIFAAKIFQVNRVHRLRNNLSVKVTSSCHLSAVLVDTYKCVI